MSYLIQRLCSPLFRNAPKLKLKLEGLEIMNDDPTDVDVLYGKVKVDIPKFNTTFQKMADQIVDTLSKKGLIRKQYENVKLHVTLMNSLFRKKMSGEALREYSRREPFDASYILEKYRNFHFGETNLDLVHLSIRFTTGKNGFYDPLLTIPLC